MEIEPAAMAMAKETEHLEQGKYGPIFPKTPACYGFTIIAKIIPGREPVFHQYAKSIENAVAAQPNCLAPLKLHYLRWVLFPIKGETYFMYQGIFDTDFDKYTEDAVALFTTLGVKTVFENLEGFPWIGRPTRPHSLSLFGTTTARAFWSTENTHSSAQMRSRRH